MAAVPPATVVSRFRDLPREARLALYQHLPTSTLNVGGPNNDPQEDQLVTVSRQVSAVFRVCRPANRVCAIFWSTIVLRDQHPRFDSTGRFQQPWRMITAEIRGVHFRIEPAPLQPGVYQLTIRNERVFEALLRAATLFPDLTHLVIKLTDAEFQELASVTLALQQPTPFAVRVEIGRCRRYCRRCYQAERAGNDFHYHTLHGLPFRGGWERQANDPTWVKVEGDMASERPGDQSPDTLPSLPSSWDDYSFHESDFEDFEDFDL